MRLQGQVDKRLFIAVVLLLSVIIALETAVIVIFLVESATGGTSTFPGLVVHNVYSGCPTLTWTQQSTSAANRTLLFKCPGTFNKDWALKTNPIALSGTPNPYYQLFRATPTFALPAGYLSLWLTTWDCSAINGRPQYNNITLRSGQEVALGGATYLYNYCAVVDNSVAHPAGFTVNWSPGTAPIIRPAPFKLSASPTSETLPFGDVANYSITVTGLDGFAGNVTVFLRGGYTLGIPYTFTPSSLLLRAGESNTTMLQQPTRYDNYTCCARLGANTIIVEASTGCLLSVQGVCFDSYQDATLSLTINLV